MKIPAGRMTGFFYPDRAPRPEDRLTAFAVQLSA
jgi:hypothetical protein